jgi:hypothetical protein
MTLTSLFSTSKKKTVRILILTIVIESKREEKKELLDYTYLHRRRDSKGKKQPEIALYTFWKQGSKLECYF